MLLQQLSTLVCNAQRYEANEAYLRPNPKTKPLAAERQTRLKAGCRRKMQDVLLPWNHHTMLMKLVFLKRVLFSKGGLIAFPRLPTCCPPHFPFSMPPFHLLSIGIQI